MKAYHLIKKLKFNKKQRTQALKTFAILSRKADEKEKEKKTRIAIAKLFALNANTYCVHLTVRIGDHHQMLLLILNEFKRINQLPLPLTLPEHL